MIFEGAFWLDIVAFNSTVKQAYITIQNYYATRTPWNWWFTLKTIGNCDITLKR
jgi:hypothetical protein